MLIIDSSNARGKWVQALLADYDRVAPVAHEVLDADYGVYAQDSREEVLGELFRLLVQVVVDAGMLLDLGDAEHARLAVKEAVAAFFSVKPEWKATAVTPTRTQLLGQLGDGSADTRRQIDGLSESERRAWGRHWIAKGYALPAKNAGDTGSMVSRHRAPVFTRKDRAGLVIHVEEAASSREGEDSSGAMPSWREPTRVMVDGGGRPHPRPPQRRVDLQPQEQPLPATDFTDGKIALELERRAKAELEREQRVNEEGAD